MKEYRAVSGVSFAIRNSRTKTTDNDTDSGRLYWSLNTKSHPIPFIGSPFIVRHTEIRHCIFGKDNHKLPNKKALNNTEHAYSSSTISNAKKSRNILRGTVKKDCEAKIYIKEISILDNYSGDFSILTTENSKRKLRDTILAKIQEDRTKSVPIHSISRYYIEVQ